MFNTIIKSVTSEITEKKSKFICNIFHVESVEEVEGYLKEIKKRYHDARHNCYAYRIADRDICKSSDDGEPSGTAGIPILNILTGRNLNNVLVVVTRYFGGILLGTGGLVRAYSLATTEALNKSQIVEADLGFEASFIVDYKDLEELKYQAQNRGLSIIEIQYGEKVKVFVEGDENTINCLTNAKISERIELKSIEILGKKYILIDKNGKN